MCARLTFLQMLKVLMSGSVSFQNSEWDVTFGITGLWLTRLLCVLTGGHSMHSHDVCAIFGFVILTVNIQFVTQRNFHPLAPSSSDAGVASSNDGTGAATALFDDSLCRGF